MDGINTHLQKLDAQQRQEGQGTPVRKKTPGVKEDYDLMRHGIYYQSTEGGKR